MSIKQVLGRIGIILAVAVTFAIGQTSSPPQSVKIGTLTWTRQNINIETPDSWCYDNDPSNCKKYGRLYTWEAAKKVCAGMGGRWRLPADKEWDNLMKAAGAGDEDVAGKKLKSKSGWDRCEDRKENGEYDEEYCVESGNGTDDYGFSGLPGGSRDDVGSFNAIGTSGNWWSATENGADRAYFRSMRYSSGLVNKANYYKSVGNSVRCVSQ